MAGNTLGMAIQSDSDPLPVLLTRPEQESRAFAVTLADRFGPRLRPVVSPLMRPETLTPALPPGPFAGVIFTSPQGVASAAAYRAQLPDLAWCVGARTAREAQAAGYQARSADGDAVALIAAIRADPPPGPLLHLQGEDTRGDVAGQLSRAGIPTARAVVYRQAPQPLTAEAAELLSRPGVVLVPLFSPRSALLFLKALPTPTGADLRLAAISPAAAEVLSPLGLPVAVARRPDAEAMVEAVGSLIAAAPPP